MANSRHSLRTKAPSLPVGRRSDWLLFSNPSLFVFDVSEKLLQAKRIGQLLLPLLQRLLQSAVSGDETIGLLGDVLSVEMSGLLELLALNLDAVDSILMGRDVSLQQCVLLLKVLYASQVLVFHRGRKGKERGRRRGGEMEGEERRRIKSRIKSRITRIRRRKKRRSMVDSEM